MGVSGLCWLGEGEGVFWLLERVGGGSFFFFFFKKWND